MILHVKDIKGTKMPKIIAKVNLVWRDGAARTLKVFCLHKTHGNLNKQKLFGKLHCLFSVFHIVVFGP